MTDKVIYGYTLKNTEGHSAILTGAMAKATGAETSTRTRNIAIC